MSCCVWCLFTVGSANQDSSSEASNQVSNVGGSKFKDPCWEHAIRISNSTQRLNCKYCNQVISSWISRYKHLAGQQGSCAPCLKVSDDVKMKVIEMLKADNAKKEAKQAGFQALINDVRTGADEYEYEYKDVIEGSSQMTKFGSISIKTTWLMDKFTQWTLKELTLSLLKRSKLPWTLSKEKREGKTPLEILGNSFTKPRFPSILLLFPRSNRCW